MDTQQQEHYLLSKRDSAEAKRLNRQNTIIYQIRSGHALEPEIPTQNITRIADIASGTGIWLEDISADLSASGNRNYLQLFGFDISLAQFPKFPPVGTKFVVCDINEGFPEEYHETFDIVHVRALVVALTVEQIGPAVEKVVKLLKPGGYLQWTDLDFTNSALHLEDFYPDAVRSEGEMTLEFFSSQNFSLSIFTEIQKSLQGCSVEGVKLIDHGQEGFKRPELKGLLLEWHMMSINVLLPAFAKRSGKNKGEIEELLERYAVKAEEMARKGTVFVIPLLTLIAKKRV